MADCPDRRAKSREGTALEKKLFDLSRFRVSQMNGCAYCLDMHWKDLRRSPSTAGTG
jgi:AhpD family alkylhydroperoxidase